MYCYIGSISLDSDNFKRVAYLSLKDYLKMAGLIAFGDPPSIEGGKGSGQIQPEQRAVAV
jgi:hypothetical protein